MIAIGTSQRSHLRIPGGPQALRGGRECSDGISRGVERVCGCTRRFERPGLRMQLAEHAGSPRCGDLHAQTSRCESGCGRIDPPVRLHGLDAHDHGAVHLPQARHVLAQPREHVTNTVWHVIPDPADLTIDRVAVGDGFGRGLGLILLDRARLPVGDSRACLNWSRARDMQTVRRVVLQPGQHLIDIGSRLAVSGRSGPGVSNAHQSGEQPSR